MGLVFVVRVRLPARAIMPGGAPVNEPAADLSERLARLDAAGGWHPGDWRVIELQLTRAEGKLLKGQRDVRRELRIVEQRVLRAEHRLRL
jgi:hypothetical protein